MRHSRVVLSLSLVLLAYGLVPCPAASASTPQEPAPDAGSAAITPDDEARFIAGLPVANSSPLHALQEGAAWKTHAAALDTAWAKLDQNRLAKMAAWAEGELGPRIPPKAPVVYLFGGPDAISVNVLYPDAPLYVVCGLEQPGDAPHLEALPAPEVERALVNLRTLLRSTVDLSYFITSVMGPELQRTKLRGVLPVLLVFLARHGDRILETEAVFLDPAGTLQPSEIAAVPANGVPGWRIRFQRGGAGPVRELLYFRLDVHNDALPSRPGLFPFLQALGPVNSFLKAASFILHDRHFSTARTYLLEHSASLLQDDSGVPFHFFPPAKWELRFFGEYTPNKGVFSDHFQPDMKKAWSQAPPLPLPFSTGYRHERGSNLLLALPRRDEASAPSDAGR